MAAPFSFGEALVLGLASGPACVASCGPVVVPSLLAEPGGLRLNSRYLSVFLTTRLCGYLLFAGIAWELGTLASLRSPTHVLIVGIMQLLLGCVLLLYAHSVGRACTRACTSSQLVRIGSPQRHSIPAAGVLGFLTGVSLCPPFLTAGVRAAEASNLAEALLFFSVFFVGTSFWFLPFASFAWIRRSEAVTTVARMTLLLIALYYLYVGLAAMMGKTVYGY